MIVIDTSALAAIILQEEEIEVFSVIIEHSRGALVSAGTAIELLTIATRNELNYDSVKSFLGESYFTIEPVDSEQVHIAGEAYRKYGRGDHPAELNLGDMFAYALSKQRNLPLLFKGESFLETDVTPVSGYFHYGLPD